MLGSSIIFSVLLLFSVHCFSQQPEYLLKFIDSTTMKAGYKTLDGNIHFSATLDEGSTMANTFYTIVSAYEIRNDVRYHFYLLRNGTRLFERKVKDNDFLPFCESEGKIGFYDAVKRKFGFLNSSGKVIIPAIYDGVHRFVNGVCLVDKAKASAKRDEGEMPEAMDEFLINEKNEVLVKDWTWEDSYLNLYSMKILDAPVDTEFWVSMQGVNGKWYCFMDYQAEFISWYFKDFVPALYGADKGFERFVFDSLSVRKAKEEGIVSRKDFLAKYSSSALASSLDTAGGKTIASLNSGGLLYELKTLSQCRKFFNPCGREFEEKYPAFDLMINHFKKRTAKQSFPPPHPMPGESADRVIDFRESFCFIRDDDGYKLISTFFK